MAFNCKTVKLQQNNNGSQVTELQNALKKLGFYTAKVDGSFGPKTYTAVYNFQTKYGLAKDGVFGEQTCTKLASVMGTSTTTSSSSNSKAAFDCPNTSLKEGSKGDLVTKLQNYLKDWGYYKSTVDGDYGGVTKQAVIDFQNDAGGLQPDGWFGPATCAKLVARLKEENDEDTTPPYVLGSTLKKIPLYARGLSAKLTMYPEIIVADEIEVEVQTTTDTTATDTTATDTTDGTDTTTTDTTTTTPETTTTKQKITRYRIQEMGKGKTSPNTSGGTTGGFDCSTTNLNVGATGADVTKLQTGLKSMGYYQSTIDGSYGPKTAAAVRLLQAAVGGLTPDGWFGPQTCPKYNAKLGVNTSKTDKNTVKANLVITDLFNPQPNSDIEGLTHDCTLRVLYTKDNLERIQVMQRCLLEMMQDNEVVYSLDGYVSESKIVQENNVFFIELNLTGYSLFLEQDFADYGGNKKQSEHLKAICKELGLMLKLDLNGLPDENIEINKVVQAGSSSTGGTAGKTVQMNNVDCNPSDRLETHHWGGSHKCKPPKCTAVGKQMRGNSNRQYARDTASHNGSSRELVTYVESKVKYEYINGSPYADNPHGQSHCPENIWTTHHKGNCADLARLLKVILDVNGYKSIICHIPGHFYNAIWENGGWTVCDLCAQLHGLSAYGHANHGDVKPTGTWDNPSG